MPDEIKRAPIEHPPIYAPYPNPHLADFVRENAMPYDAASDDYKVAPFARDISEGKNDPIYNAHSYHTKVPPKAIEPFIQHYTKPGDLVLDPFCGSGMTGVAALHNGRKCILIDLSPAATFIAYCYGLN
jgi:DNA modification methylase